MIDCANVAAGIPGLACISAETNYLVGYAFIIILTGILFFRLGAIPMRERMASTMLVLSMITFLGSIQQMLFPSEFFFVSATLFLGSLVLLVIRS